MKNNLLMSLFILISISTFTFSQNDESWKVYDDTEVAIYNITMDENDLQFMFENPQSDSMHLASIKIKNAILDETIDSVGIRIRGNTSRESNKKSLKLSFNTFKKGRKFYSLEKINLNGEHNDPSIIRSKLSWDFFNDIKVKSSRAAHAAVYINEKYFGLYVSIEHIDENFLSKNFDDDTGNLWKCLYGSDLKYINNNPNTYKMSSGEHRVYDLITNNTQDDYSKLAELIDLINNSDDETFKTQLPLKLNLLGTLQYFAINILTGGWDDYWFLTNNYYLYHQPSTDQFNLIPYDYDNTFGIDFFNIDWASVNPYVFAKINNGPRPLITRLLKAPEFRNLFTHLIKFYKEKYTQTSMWISHIDELKNKITAFAIEDTFRVKDYGFSIEDFNNSYFADGFSKDPAKYSLKDFINKRNSTLENQLNFVDANPIIYDINITANYFEAFDTIYVNCSVFSSNGIKKVKAELLNTKTDETYFYEMQFNPNLSSLDIKENDLWKGKIFNIPNSFSGELKIVVEDSSGKIISYPSKAIKINTPGDVTQEVLLSELMSSNSTTIQDNFSEYDDWLEIYNSQDTSVNLSGKYLTDKIDNLTKWQFPENFVIQPNQHILIWCDEDSSQGINHANFKLSADGEFVAIVNNDGVTIIDSVTLPKLNVNESYARQNNSGDWSVTNSPTPGEDNLIVSINNQKNDKYFLKLNAYPNPFNPSTKIEYRIPNSERLNNFTIKIYDILGREITTLLNEKQKPGDYIIEWNAINQTSGVYIIHLYSESFTKTLKLLLIR